MSSGNDIHKTFVIDTKESLHKLNIKYLQSRKGNNNIPNIKMAEEKDVLGSVY